MPVAPPLTPRSGSAQAVSPVYLIIQIYPRFTQGTFGFRYCHTGTTAMSEVCSICGGSGLRVMQENGRQFAQDCVCRIQRRAERMLERARIPTRYEHCTLDSYIVSGPPG